MSRETKLYFESHAHDFNYPELYSRIVEVVRKLLAKTKNLAILDVGCGNGAFIKSLINKGIEARYTGTDLSVEMIRMAKSNLSVHVDLFIADSFSMPLSPGVKFDVIHIGYVLHHLIKNTRTKSVALVKKLIKILVTRLSVRGVLIVDELYYDSYLIQNLTSITVFYGLKIINFFNLDLSRFNKQLKPGLEVNFFNEKYLLNLLQEYGSSYVLSRIPWPLPRIYKAVLLRKWGCITFIVRKPIL